MTTLESRFIKYVHPINLPGFSGAIPSYLLFTSANSTTSSVPNLLVQGLNKYRKEIFDGLDGLASVTNNQMKAGGVIPTPNIHVIRFQDGQDILFAMSLMPEIYDTEEKVINEQHTFVDWLLKYIGSNISRYTSLTAGYIISYKFTHLTGYGRNSVIFILLLDNNHSTASSESLIETSAPPASGPRNTTYYSVSPNLKPT
jgi:hypothetical protein